MLILPPKINPYGLRLNARVHNHHPDDDIGHIIEGSSSSGGGATESPPTAEEKTLVGLTPFSQIKKMFGGIPHLMTNEHGEVEILAGKGDENHVRKICSRGTEQGLWAVKRLIYGAGIADFDIGLIRQDHLERELGRKFFSCSGLVFPTGYGYQDGDNLYMITSYIDSEEDEVHFRSMGPRLMADLAAHYLIFGLWDLKAANIRKATNLSHPIHIEYYPEQVTAEMTGQAKPHYANIDTGIAFVDSPRRITPSIAINELGEQAPFVDLRGNNSLKSYKRAHAFWVDYIEDNNFLREFYLIAKKAGYSREEAEKYLNEVVKPNIGQFMSNIDMFVAAANGELPTIVLTDMKWHGSEKPVAVNFTGGSFEKHFSSDKQLFLELNDMHLLFLDLVDNGKLRIQCVFNDDINPFIVEPDKEVTIGKEKKTNMLSLPRYTIAEHHLLIQNLGDGNISFHDLQSRLSSKYWE